MEKEVSMMRRISFMTKMFFYEKEFQKMEKQLL